MPESRGPLRAALLAAYLASATALHGQTWDSPEARALVDRAVLRRSAALADTALRDFSARAHGFVFFLGQIGEGLAEPPRLIKADQLELEVYWRAPNRSKQRIIGWRDRRDLPTDINYHRDHLGIVLNNFADRIRLGEGDEVRDIPHPLSVSGRDLYEFALVDSVSLALPDREIQVYELRVRPRDFRGPRLLGSLFVDVALADLVRMTFNFTRGAYLDPQLEDISVAIENSLWGGRYWLPLRQEIEIRRRAEWMDFPARGIIRGRWEIDTYRFNQNLGDELFRSGPEIVVASPEVRASFPWTDSLDAAVRDIAQPALLFDFDAVRAQATAVAVGHVLTGLRRAQFGGASISDFIRFNRVEGLALGLGATLRSADEARELKARVSTATARRLVSGGLSFSLRRGSTTLKLSGYGTVRDLGDLPVTSRAINSLSAQEAGADYGDYYFARGGEASVTRALGGRTTLALSAAVERVDSLITRASWARGEFERANPGVDQETWQVARLVLQRRPFSFATSRELSGRVEIEGGAGGSDYLRAVATLRWRLPAGARGLVWRMAGGSSTGNLPRHRTFALGGRGTVPGTPFRALMGRHMAWTSAEFQVPVRVGEIPLGSFAGTGPMLIAAPFVAAAWTDGGITGLPGGPSRGVEPSVGLGLGWLHGLLRLDVGFGLRSGRVSAAFDVSRDFWDIL